MRSQAIRHQAQPATWTREPEPTDCEFDVRGALELAASVLAQASRESDDPRLAGLFMEACVSIAAVARAYGRLQALDLGDPDAVADALPDLYEELSACLDDIVPETPAIAAASRWRTAVNALPAGEGGALRLRMEYGQSGVEQWRAEPGGRKASARQNSFALPALQALAARLGGSLRFEHAGRGASISLVLG